MKVVEIDFSDPHFMKHTKLIKVTDKEAKFFEITYKGTKICVQELLVNVDDKGNLIGLK